MYISIHATFDNFLYEILHALIYICNISVSDQTKFSLYHTNAHCIYISNIDVANAFYNIIYQKWNDVQLFVLRVHNSYFLFLFYSVYFYTTALSQHRHPFLLLNHLENILQSLLRHLMLIAKQEFILCYSNSFNLLFPFFNITHIWHITKHCLNVDIIDYTKHIVITSIFITRNIETHNED